VEATLRKLADYLKETLGVAVAHSPWRHVRLPHFIKETYKFSEAKILGVRCLLMLDSGEQAPAALRKHIDLVKATWDGEIIYVRPQLTAYNRKRLVEHKVPFIVPGNQMYLPMLAIDFREHFRRLHEEPQTLSPSAQVLMIHLLLNVGEDVLTPKEAAARLGYSAMSMTRAFNELEATQLVEVYTRGRERHLSLVARSQDTWTKALAFVRSPVKKQLCIQRIGAASRGRRAGLTALAEYTMLAPPARLTYALSGKDWLSLRQQHTVVEVPQQDPDALEIEVWSYSPAQFAEGDLVDPLSLYLSLRDSDDERVTASLEELMEKVKW
jgi:DNA-binding MarR family transcriptional regulator